MVKRNRYDRLRGEAAGVSLGTAGEPEIGNFGRETYLRNANDDTKVTE